MTLICHLVCPQKWCLCLCVCTRVHFFLLVFPALLSFLLASSTTALLPIAVNWLPREIVFAPLAAKCCQLAKLCSTVLLKVAKGKPKEKWGERNDQQSLLSTSKQQQSLYFLLHSLEASSETETCRELYWLIYCLFAEKTKKCCGFGVFL